MRYTAEKDTETSALYKLAGILLLAFLVRLPGVFWGVQPNDVPHFINYHPDEPHITQFTRELLGGLTNEAESYPKGFPFQIALITRLIGLLVKVDDAAMIMAGRMISLFYGVITVLIVYLLAKELFSDVRSALISALFLSLAGLHVTQSHFSTVDAGTTFWFYATVLCSLLYCRKGKSLYLLLSLVSSGFALAFKLSWFSILPVLYALVRLRKAPLHWALSVTGILAFFILANGGRYTAGNIGLTLNNVLHDNLNVIARHNKYLNPLVYSFELVAGLGLPVFLIAVYGLLRILRQTGGFGKIFRSEVSGLLALPLILHLISISFLDIPFARQILPVIPAAALLAAYGYREISASRPFSVPAVNYLLLSIVCLYQVVYVVSTQYYFVRDTREAAGVWIRNSIRASEKITTTPYVEIPNLKKGYQTVDTYDSPFIILHEAYYYRYLRSCLNPFRKYPDWEEIYHGSHSHFLNIQKLFRGEPGYRLIKKFEVRAVTPEMILYKKFWGTYSQFTGDLLVFEKTGIH